MAYIPLEEAANLEELKYNTMVQRLKRKPEDYKTKIEQSDDGGKARVMVALSSLSKTARRKYKAQTFIDALDSSLIKTRTDEVCPWYIDVDYAWYQDKYKTSFYKAIALLKSLEDYLSYDDNNRTAYAEVMADKLGISTRSLYRYTQSLLEASAWALKRHKDDGQNYDYFKVLALCRKPKKLNTFPGIDADLKAYIEGVWFYKNFAKNRGTVDMLYGKLRAFADEVALDCPSYQTVCRYISHLMRGKKNAHYLASEGLKQYKNKTMVKGSRDIQSLAVMELVQGDEHTFDCWVAYTHPNGHVSAIRPTLVAWIDIRSNVLVSTVMCHHANSRILKESLLKMIYNPLGGVPKKLLIDNGKDYKSKTMKGTGEKRFYDSIDSIDEDTIGFYESVGIESVSHSLPYQAWSKAQVERFFGTLINKFTKWLDSYTGTLTGSKTIAKVDKDINKMLERGVLLDINEFYTLFSKWLEVYHNTEHGTHRKNKEVHRTPKGLFEHAENKYYKPAPPKSYAIASLMQAEVASVYNIGIRRFGYEYRADALCDYINSKVKIKYDPNDVTTLYVYSMDNHFICTAQSQALLDMSYGDKVQSQVIKDHMAMQNRQLKSDRQVLNEVKESFESMIAKYNQNYEGAIGFDLNSLMVKNAHKDNVVAMPKESAYTASAKRISKKRNAQGQSEYLKAQGKAVIKQLKELG